MSTGMQLKSVLDAEVAVGTYSSVDDVFDKELDRLQEELLQEFDVVGGKEQTVSGSTVSADVVVAQEEEAPKTSRRESRDMAEIIAAQAAVSKARAEKTKLWDAATAMMTDHKAVAELRHRDAVSSAHAEEEFEKQRLADAWTMIRDICDMSVFSAITRKVHDQDGEHTVSVGIARRLFENSGPTTIESRSFTPRPQTHIDARSVTSQSRRIRLGRDGCNESDLPFISDEPLQQISLPLTRGGIFGCSAVTPQPSRSISRPSSNMPPRPPQQGSSIVATDTDRCARMSMTVQSKWKFGASSNAATPTKKAAEENKENTRVDSESPAAVADGKVVGWRQDSPSVRDRILALQKGMSPAKA